MIETRRKRDELRRQIIGEMGRSRKYNTLIKKLRKEMIVKRKELKIKYREKTNHLDKLRKIEIEERKQERKIPDEIYDYKDCKIFDINKARKLALIYKTFR